VTRWIVEGALRGYRVAGLWRVDPADLDAFLVPTVTPKPVPGVDPVRYFNRHAQDYVRWVADIHDAADRAARAHAGALFGDTDQSRLEEIVTRSEALSDSLIRWVDPDSTELEPGGAS